MLRKTEDLVGDGDGRAVADKISAAPVAVENNGKFDGKLADIRERHQRWVDHPAWVSLNEQAEYPKDVGVLLAEVDRLRGAGGPDVASGAAWLRESTVAWLRESVKICRDAAAAKESGWERAGWAEDAAHFEAALALILGESGG